MPATPVSHQRYNNRQLPNYTSPSHQIQSHRLPKQSRLLPSSIGNAASTFSSLLGVGKAENVPRRSLFSLLSESKPASQKESYIESTFNENFNYAYEGMEGADDLIVSEENIDGDNNNMVNGRLRALPSLPMKENMSSVEYDVYGY